MAEKKKAETQLVLTDLDWLIVRPSALTKEPGMSQVDLGLAKVHTEIARDDVAAAIVELLRSPDLPPRSRATAAKEQTTRSSFRSRSPLEDISAGTPTASRRRSTLSPAAVSCCAMTAPGRWARAASSCCRRMYDTICGMSERNRYWQSPSFLARR